MKIIIGELIDRMTSEGIPESLSLQIVKNSGSVEELKLRIRSYLVSINADNVNNKIRRICKR